MFVVQEHHEIHYERVAVGDFTLFLSLLFSFSLFFSLLRENVLFTLDLLLFVAHVVIDLAESSLIVRLHVIRENLRESILVVSIGLSDLEPMGGGEVEH